MSIKALSAARTMGDICDWNLTNLTMQKLLYISEMIWVGHNEGNDSLVEESFEAWDYGPVLPSVYHRAKAFGDVPVQNVFTLANSWTDSRREFLNDVTNAFKDFQPFDLVEYTHWPKGAWARNYVAGVRGIVIPRKDIFEEYRARVE